MMHSKPTLDIDYPKSNRERSFADQQTITPLKVGAIDGIHMIACWN